MTQIQNNFKFVTHFLNNMLHYTRGTLKDDY